MKVQSGLMGNHERQAEMTCPRFGGVTKWNNGIDEYMKKDRYACCEYCAHPEDVRAAISAAAHAQWDSDIERCVDQFDTMAHDNFEKMVNILPCHSAMSGLHSVNSVNISPGNPYLLNIIEHLFLHCK